MKSIDSSNLLFLRIKKLFSLLFYVTGKSPEGLHSTQQTTCKLVQMKMGAIVFCREEHANWLVFQ